MIPLRLHFIWMGRKFPFVNRLAIESARQLHPGAEIILHYEDPPVDNPDWEALRSKAQFRPIDLPALLAALPEGLRPAADALGRISSGYPAGKSNVLRYLILYRDGGVYLDFDTLTLKSFAPLLASTAFVGEEEVFAADDDRVAGRYAWNFPIMAALFGASYGLAQLNARALGNLRALDAANRALMKTWSERKLNNAILGAVPGAAFFGRALELVPDTDAGLRFALGPMLMNRVYDERDPAAPVTRLSKDVFYAIPPSQTVRFFYGAAPKLPPEAVAVHWCSSNHKALAPMLTREVLSDPRRADLYSALAREILARGID
jgi:hypothetical protein